MTYSAWRNQTNIKYGQRKAKKESGSSALQILLAKQLRFVKESVAKYRISAVYNGASHISASRRK